MPTSSTFRVLTTAIVALPLFLGQVPTTTAVTPVTAVPDRPDSAAAQARQSGQRVELPDLRSTSREVYVNPNGTHTMVQHATPVRTGAAAGWKALDPTLHFGADGNVRPAVGDKGVVFSGGGTGADLVRLGGPNQHLTVGWPGVLPKPVLQGDTATYGEVLPGVDLQLRAEPAGFAKALVVKNRAAASNPALRELRFRLGGAGLTFTRSAGGTTLAKDRRGRAVFASGQPLMWDSATEPVTKAAASTLAAGVLTIRPDQAMLNAPTTQYPVTIDPSWSDEAGDMWTHVDARVPTMSYWGYDRDQGAKVGQAWGPDTDTYRSLFNLDTTKIAGARVVRARFTVVLDHSPDGNDHPVDLYRTTPISRSADVTWNSTGWPQYLATASGHARSSEPDMTMGWESPALKDLIQKVATDRDSSVSLGLAAPDETNEYQWKRFRGETATVIIDYNNAPRMPLKVNFDIPKTCGTAAAPTPIGTRQPAFSGVAGDPDGDTLINKLEIHRAAGDTTVYTQNSGITGNGAAFTWSPVPDGVLSDDTAYYYVARSDDQVADDGIDSGPATARCYFTIDSRLPGEALRTSTDFPDGRPGKPAREVGTMTFSPAAGDTDIAEYQYGFEQAKIVLTIKARPDGTAVLPISVPSSSRKLWVRAVDKAGNPGPLSVKAWTLLAQTNGTAPRVRSDVNGDGAADVVMVVDQGFGRTGVWNVLSRSGTFGTGTMAWDSGINGGFALSRSKPVQGDFTGDGRTDLAFFRDEPGRRVALYTMVSDGNRYEPPSTPNWKAPQADWTIATAHVTSGDVTGDKVSDIVVQLNSGNGGWRVVVYPGGNLSAPVQWLQTTTAGGDWAVTQPVLSDVDGDGKDDLVVVRKTGDCRTVVNVYKSSGTAFGAATTAYDGAYCFDKGHPVAGDVDGDGKGDVVSVYDNGSGTVLKTFRSTGTAFTLSDWWTGADRDPLRTAVQVGDLDKDGKADAALISSLTGGGRQVAHLRSTGTAFEAPVNDWSEAAVGASDAGPKFDLESRTYELVARNSGKCMEVAGASRTDPALIQQWDCLNGLHQRFRVVPVAGTDQYELHMVHLDGTAIDGTPRCIDVGNQSFDDNTPIVQWKCLGQGNQQILIDYVEGSSYDTVFRVRFGHSGKCAGVENAGTANGAKIIQKTCAAVPEQQWFLRAALNTTQLDGRYKIRALRDPGKDYVLDIKNCDPLQGVRTWDWISDSPCQRWQLKPLGDDVYQIIDPSTGTALQVENCSRMPAAKLVAFGTDASECQRWRIEPAADNSWTLQQADTGLMVDVPDCVGTTVEKVIVWHYWNGPCQRWQLTKM
ncbi:RICIN domain-containing protein [Kribbella antibiotica]|uniref:RICIN domain-containing protein n=1 Tax=Kribbella antibiotica TaxID=190195 RepID=UPI001404907E|nr:RICIN domain-containing protein [Kribbella antibiotica]